MSSGNQPSQLKRKTRLVQHRKEYNEGEDEDEWMPIDDDEENDDNLLIQRKTNQNQIRLKNRKKMKVSAQSPNI